MLTQGLLPSSVPLMTAVFLQDLRGTATAEGPTDRIFSKSIYFELFDDVEALWMLDRHAFALSVAVERAHE